MILGCLLVVGSHNRAANDKKNCTRLDLDNRKDLTSNTRIYSYSDLQHKITLDRCDTVSLKIRCINRRKASNQNNWIASEGHVLGNYCRIYIYAWWAYVLAAWAGTPMSRDPEIPTCITAESLAAFWNIANIRNQKNVCCSHCRTWSVDSSEGAPNSFASVAASSASLT